MLSLTLFGSMSATLHYPGATQGLSLTPRPAELLAFLAIGRGRFFARRDIAISLWSALGEDASAGTVNTVLWRLRRALEHEPAHPGDFLVTNPQGAIGLNGPVPVELDLREFEIPVKAALAKPIAYVTTDDCTALQRAIALYRDDVLADFHSSWALRERERLRTLYMSSVNRLIQLASAQRRYTQAVEYAHLILTIDPLREDVRRDLMRLLVKSGKRALALKQFEECRAVLRRELGIPPMHETLTLYRQIADCSIESVDALGERHDSSAPSIRGAPCSADEVRAARSLLADADRHLKKSLESLDTPDSDHF